MEPKKGGGRECANGRWFICQKEEFEYSRSPSTTTVASLVSGHCGHLRASAAMTEVSLRYYIASHQPGAKSHEAGPRLIPK
jgi:hypothetical protein